MKCTCIETNGFKVEFLPRVLSIWNVKGVLVVVLIIENENDTFTASLYLQMLIIRA